MWHANRRSADDGSASYRGNSSNRSTTAEAARRRWGSVRSRGGIELEDLLRCRQVEGGEDVLRRVGGLAGLGEGAGGAGAGTGMQVLQVLADGGPGVRVL